MNGVFTIHGLYHAAYNSPRNEKVPLQTHQILLLWDGSQSIQHIKNVSI